MRIIFITAFGLAIVMAALCSVVFLTGVDGSQTVVRTIGHFPWPILDEQLYLKLMDQLFSSGMNAVVMYGILAVTVGFNWFLIGLIFGAVLFFLTKPFRKKHYDY